MSELSQSTRALLRAAKSDAPSAASKAGIWTGVATAAHASLGGAAGASGTGGAAIGAAASGSGKVLFGVLLGSVITAGIAAVVLRLGPLALPPVEVVPDGPRVEVYFSAPVSRASVDTAPTDVVVPVAKPVARAKGNSGPRLDDALTREALLVAEGRGALRRGDPGAALAAVRAARSLEGHELEPEELSIEVAALRALDREGEALLVESKLRARYPDHALSR